MFLDKVLEPPDYGYEREGKLYIPSKKEIFSQFFNRLNIFSDKKNWLPAWSWLSTFLFAIPLYLFLVHFFSIPLFIVGFIYSMVILGTHGTIYLHRYSTHRAYKFTHWFWLFFVRNCVVKVVLEELYVVSHHVHHSKSEQPGDPYNAHAGWWYCFLADANHQPIRRDLSKEEYQRVTALLSHTGMHINSFKQYQKWGSVTHPAYALLHYFLNWVFWYVAFYLMGGHGLALAVFGSCGVWGIGVRTFNYDGHGGGKDKRREGIDFNRKDLSINQLWPGLVTGEWHNNHHLYPNGVRAGFLPYQIDYAWYFIKCLDWLGGVTNCRDYTQEFFEKYYNPYLQNKRLLTSKFANT